MYRTSGEEALEGSDEETFSMKLKKFWTRTSLGGFATPSNRFYESPLSDSKVNLALSCPQGKFSIDPDVSYYGLIGNEELAIYTMYMIDSTCNKNEVFQQEIKKCEDMSQCDIKFDNSWFDSNCLKDFESGNKLYLKMYCKETTLEFLGRVYNKEQYSILIVGINILTLIFYLLYLMLIAITESNLKGYYEKKNASPNDYAIRLKNLPQGLDEQEMIGKLYDHFSRFANENKIEEPLVDITVAQQNEMFTLNKKIYENDDMLSYYYEELKGKKYMKGKNLDDKLNMEHLRKIIHDLEKPKCIK